MSECICPSPGHCTRFNREMPGNFWRVCHDEPGIIPENRDFLLAQWNAEHEATIAHRASAPRRDASCAHLGPFSGETRECLPCGGKTREKLYGCAVHGQCTIRDCRKCPDQLAPQTDIAGFGPAPNDGDHYALTFSKGATMSLFRAEGQADRRYAGYLKGQTVFFLGGGPSLGDVDLSRLSDRFTLAVNGVAEVYPDPTIWLCVDDPTKFAAPWSSPDTLKLVPRAWASSETPGGMPICLCPSVRFFVRNARFHPWSFLYERSVNWGSDDPPDRRSVMLAAVKLAFYFGVSRLVLLGCDFDMQPERPYVHSHPKDAGACLKNNMRYETLAKRLAMLRPILEDAGMTIVNATVGSQLDAFERVDLDDELALTDVRSVPSLSRS